ncbi:hypothetical protein FPSE_05065 [Fusarium pseudograminearum CS3096]|uniref:Uncharacterized protein n=1 Tax=Fusarium pseudograminearum (strain CS3096) TaxID=1028729 RepID=K3W0T9_FUSPC|nr:hypothetical protein FPSE_05065 [Fusarium pseudograminearum CS3096]EKJ74730.1 hypothetical protein FPSE_05065 [Fusarium pseudograminearum CS3096]
MFAPGTIRTANPFLDRSTLIALLQGFYKITPVWCVIHRRGSQPFLNCCSQLGMSCEVPIKESAGYDDSPDKSSESTQTGTEVAPISSRPLRTANSSSSAVEGSPAKMLSQGLFLPITSYVFSQCQTRVKLNRVYMQVISPRSGIHQIVTYHLV